MITEACENPPLTGRPHATLTATPRLLTLYPRQGLIVQRKLINRRLRVEAYVHNQSLVRWERHPVKGEGLRRGERECRAFCVLAKQGARALLSEDAEGATLTLTPAEPLTLDGVTLPPHERLIVDVRFDPQAPIDQLSLNDQPLPWVESEEAWRGCERCVWAPRQGRVLARLGDHEGAPQVVSW